MLDAIHSCNTAVITFFGAGLIVGCFATIIALALLDFLKTRKEGKSESK